MSENNSPNLNNDKIENECEPEVSTKEIPEVMETEQKTDENGEAVASSKDDENTKKKSFKKDFIESLELVAISFAVIVILFSLFFRVCTVDGTSMQDTLEHGDVVICSNLFYSPNRGDIVVIHQNSEHFNEPLVKRVIGLPGDLIQIEYLSQSKMKVSIIDKDGNKTVLEEDYIKLDTTKRPPYSNQTILVEEGTVFVMGDNRYNSADSRLSEIGLIDTRRILGKVMFRVAPLNKLGSV